MSSRPKNTVFPQHNVRRNFPNYSKLDRSFKSHDDRAMFYMLADATCSPRPKADIEKIHVNVFKNQKLAELKNISGIMETLEIMSDAKLRELRLSEEDAKKGRIIPWKEIRTHV